MQASPWQYTDLCSLVFSPCYLGAGLRNDEFSRQKTGHGGRKLEATKPIIFTSSLIIITTYIMLGGRRGYTPLFPALEAEAGRSVCEFKASPVLTASSRTVRVMQRKRSTHYLENKF